MVDSSYNMTDIGANLTNRAFADNLDEVLAASTEAGVPAVIITGTTTRGSNQAAQIVAKYRDTHNLYSTAGVHPHNANDFCKNVKKSVNLLRVTLEKDRVVAVGECGLDYVRGFSTRENQLTCFEEQLKLAASKKKPLFLHERGAHDDFVALLDKYATQLKGVPKVVHCFTEGRDQVSAYLSRGCYIGFTAFIGDKKKNEEVVHAVKEVPMDRLLVETDAPYMKPWFFRERTNVPANVLEVVKMVARIKKLRFHQVFDQVTANAATVFGLTYPTLTNPFKTDDDHRGGRSGGRVPRGEGDRRRDRGRGRGRWDDRQSNEPEIYNAAGERVTLSWMIPHSITNASGENVDIGWGKTSKTSTQKAKQPATTSGVRLIPDPRGRLRTVPVGLDLNDPTQFPALGSGSGEISDYYES